MIIVPAVAAPVAVILLCCVIWIVAIICISQRLGKKKEQQYTSLIARMELIEYEMADECKRGIVFYIWRVENELVLCAIDPIYTVYRYTQV